MEGWHLCPPFFNSLHMGQNINTLKDKFLDEDFEYSLIKQIIGVIHEDGTRDTRFGQKIMGFVNSEYFSSRFTRIIIDNICEYHKKYKKVPSYKELSSIIHGGQYTDIEKAEVKKMLSKISKIKTEFSPDFVEANANEFFKEQSLLSYAYSIISQVTSGKGPSLDTFISNTRELKRKLYQEERPYEITEDDYSYIDKDDGYFVPLGWGDDLDTMVNFRQGSMLLCLAPTGVGKTTAAAVTAVKNFLDGKKVLLVFFEDDYADVYKKIIARLSGMKINDLKNNKGAVISITKNRIKNSREKGGKIVMIKKSAINTTTDDFENIVENFKAEHGTLDLAILDYIDCLKSSSGKKYSESYQEEYDVIMEVLDMASDLNHFIPILTFTQAGRGAVNQMFVDESQTGGSYGKMKKAPQILSFSKQTHDKAEGTGNISILKNRKGQSGFLYKGGTFDNERVIINFSKEHIEVASKTSK